MSDRYKKLTILHSNDMHGDFLAEQVGNNLVGGVSMLSGYIDYVREREENVLYCIAGDMFRGSVIDSEYRGLSTIEIMNMLKPDIVTIGNHETDYGLAHLLFIEKCAQFPIINANLHVTITGTRLFEPYKIIEIDGMKILFIGITTEDVIANTKTQDNVIGSFIDIGEAAEEVGKICNSFNGTDIDFTILLTHIGWDEDHELAKKLNPAWGVDVIIGGHSHTFIDKPDIVNNVAIVQAGTGTDQIGRFDIIVDTQNNCIESYKWQAVPINQDTCPRDPKIETLINGLKSKTDEKYQKVVTRFKHTLLHETRTAQTPLGSVYADIFKRAYGVDVALISSGSVRKNELGPIVTYQEVIESYPYAQSNYIFKVTGKQLRDMLTYSYRDDAWNGAHTEFFQLSEGMHVKYSKSKHMIIDFSLNGNPIEEEKLYSISLQKYQVQNFLDSFGFKIDEIEKNMPRKEICTSDQDVIYENILTGNYKETRGNNRLEIVD